MAYTGVTNLEVMEDARCYNAYLLRQIAGSAPARGTTLDFGAGTGTFAAPLAALGADVLCVEQDQALHDRLAARGLRVVADLSSVPNGTIAYIYSLNVLEHIRDDEGVLSAFMDKLADGGILLLYVPAFPALFSSMDALVGHVRRYQRQELVQKLERAGFSVSSAVYADSIGFVMTLLFKVIGSRSGTISRASVVLYDRLLFPLSRMLDGLFHDVFGKNLLVVAHKVSVGKNRASGG